MREARGGRLGTREGGGHPRKKGGALWARRDDGHSHLGGGGGGQRRRGSSSDVSDKVTMIVLGNIFPATYIDSSFVLVFVEQRWREVYCQHPIRA